MIPTNSPGEKTSAFLERLLAEKDQARSTRMAYTLRKLVLVTTMLGLGSIDLGKLSDSPVDLSLLLYLVPWVALGFDLYILGEDFGIKRMDTFLRARTDDALEEEWERWVSAHRDRFAPLTMPALTTILLAGAGLILYTRAGAQPAFLIVWAGVTLAFTWALNFYYLAQRQKIERCPLNDPVEGDVLSKPWLRLRAEVAQAGFTLSPGVFEQMRELYLSEFADAKKTPAGLTSEYEQGEFLRVMDGEGQPSIPTPGMLSVWRETAQEHPGFARWLSEAVLADGTPVLLAARWLCHLVGLCHATVEIFIDPPGLPGHTLVQVRGMEKFEAPGAWDIPCAGHISGTDEEESSLRKELSEELNLVLEDLDDLRLTGRYVSISAPMHGAGKNGKINNEYRVLYQAALKPEAAVKIRFADGEVAGLAVFAVPELRMLVQRSPERVASGLSGAMDFYQDNC